MNRKFILIGLLMAVFVFPVNDSFVSAKSCKKQKSKLRSRLKENIKSLCVDEILPTVLGIPDHEFNESEHAEFCRARKADGDWSVKTNPTGSCGKQKDHIRKKYGNKIEWLEAFLIDVSPEYIRLCSRMLSYSTVSAGGWCTAFGRTDGNCIVRKKDCVNNIGCTWVIRELKEKDIHGRVVTVTDVTCPPSSPRR